MQLKCKECKKNMEVDFVRNSSKRIMKDDARTSSGKREVSETTFKYRCRGCGAIIERVKVR